MTDRRLQDAYAKEAARQADQLVGRAIRRLEDADRVTGESKFDDIVSDLREVRQKIVDS